MLFRPQDYGFSSCFWLYSCFILLWSDKIVDIILVFLIILRLVLWSCIWFIVENVPWALEKNMYCVLFEWNIFCVSNKSIWSNALFKANISLLIFCLDHLSNDVSELLISCTFIVLLFISPFIPVNFCFMCLGGTCTGWIDSYKFGNKSWIHKKSIDIQISILCTFFFDREVIMQYIYLIKYLHAEYGKNYKITTKCIWMKDLSRQFIKLNIQIVTRSKGSPLSVVIREMQTIVSY